ncbi:zinc finger protein 57-like [Phlebotomus papatasi]|uniref:zinc finger protein 57-like n=1 Tax=Phlebotomus papatasi TaxID=29031 RepID=UPI002483AAB5|nr:zinc finger protein 57-like [Phlebotomus papatasi]
MRTHLLMECKADPLTCSICAQTFTKTVTLTNHVRTEHTVSKALPNCKLCAMSFISDGHFERHMKTHKENYNCPLCSKEFSYKFQIESHMRKFHSSKRTKLEFPKKTFKTEISNEKSMKKFEAKDFIIKTEAMLKTEVESKEKNDKFECPHCSKKYVNANIFLKHLSTHTEYNAENVQCSICSRKFHSKTSLRRHRSRFCMASSYICPICKTCSSTPNDFFEHLRDHDINVNKPTSVQKIQPSELQQDIEIKIEPPESETVENFKSELENL